jgi:hypothetical protein
MRLPEGTPEFLTTAIADMEVRADRMLRDPKISPETARGYYTAYRDLVDVLESEVAINEAQKLENIRKAVLKHQEELSGKFS